MRLSKNNYCTASMRNMTEWFSTERDGRGRSTCPVCGKAVLLRKNARGWRVIIPTHTPLRKEEPVLPEPLEVLDDFEREHNGFYLDEEDYQGWFRRLRKAIEARR